MAHQATASSFESLIEAALAETSGDSGSSTGSESGDGPIAGALSYILDSQELAAETIDRLAVELMFDAFEASELRFRSPGRAPKAASRAFNISRAGHIPPTLLILDPDIPQDVNPQRLTEEILLDWRKMHSIIPNPKTAASDAPLNSLLTLLSQEDVSGLREVVSQARPEVVRVRLPRMIPLCAPEEPLELRANGKLSSAGIFCRDSTGELGLTGCFHGVGPVGTPVDIGGMRQSVVKLADAVQDIVFIPLPEGFNFPDLTGVAGARNDRPPAQADPVRFNGATSRFTPTLISSHDAGLLRRQKSAQMRVQTRADTNTGDSGCALVDADDRVLGFAFQRTDYGEFPEFSDWIWAANALAALDLTPI